MRLLAFLLIWISLGVGAVAATTAYTWKVPAQGDEAFQIGSGPDGSKVYAVLAAPAGKKAAAGDTDAEGDAASEEEAEGPLFEADTALEPGVVDQLRAAGVERVRVKTFKLSRWTHLPYFGAACVGLAAGGLLTRLSAARDAKLADEQQAADDTASPDKAVEQLRVVVAELLSDIPGFGDDQFACHHVTEKLGDAIRDLVPSVTEQRERLVGRMGLGNYAALMDVFAAAERNMNRAWSAAADFALDECVESLERAGDRLVVAEDKLTGRTPSLLPLG